MPQHYSKMLSGLLSLCLTSAIVGALTASCTSASNDATAENKPSAMTVSDSKSSETGESFAREAVETSQSSDAYASTYAIQTELSEARLDLIEAEIGSEALIREHSFAVNLSRLGVVDFVPSEIKKDRALAIRWRDMNGNYIPLFLSDQWNFDRLEAVAFEDINQDGLGPDIVAIAQYYTGIGPNGAQPFSSPIVLLNDGNDTFDIDPAIENRLMDKSVSSIADVRSILSRPSAQSARVRSLHELNASTYSQLQASGQFCISYGCEPDQREYTFEDGLLQSSVGEIRMEVSLTPDRPISKEQAIAYGHVLASEANVTFTEKSSHEETEFSETYFPATPADGSMPHTGYSLTLNLNSENTVSKITLSQVSL